MCFQETVPQKRSHEEPQLIAKILSHLERAAPGQYQSELPLRKRGPPVQPSLL